MARFLTDEEFGVGSTDFPAPPRPTQTSSDPLVEAPKPGETNALLADMVNQTQPMRWQGKPVYKDAQGAFRQGSKQNAEPRFLTDEEFGIAAPLPQWTVKDNLIATIAGIGLHTMEGPAEVMGPPISLRRDEIRSLPEQDLTKPYIGYPKVASRTTLPTGDQLPANLRKMSRDQIGDIAGLADMFAGLGGMFGHLGLYSIGRVSGALQGDDPKLSAKAAEEMAADLVPEAFMAPFGKLMHSLGYGSVYNESTVSRAMKTLMDGVDKGSDDFEKATGGQVPVEDSKNLLNAAMVWLGVRGGQAAMKKAIIARAAKSAEKEMHAYDPAAAEAARQNASDTTAAPNFTVDSAGVATPSGLTPADLAKQHFETRYNSGFSNKEAQQFWQSAGREMKQVFQDPLARQEYNKAKQALVAERKKGGKTPAAVVEERLAADPPREGTPQEILKQYKEEVLGQPAESTRISEGDATRLYQTPPALRTTEQRLQLKRYENGLRTEGMFGPGSVADQVKTYASKNPGVTGAALGAVAAGITYLNSDEGDSVLPAVMASFMPVAIAHPRVKLAQHLEKIGAPKTRIWNATQLFKNEHGQWVKEVPNFESSLNPNLPRLPGDPTKVVPGHLDAGVPLRGILQDRRLYMNMPELADIPVLGETGKNTRGSFDTKAGVMRLRPGEPEQVKSTALHETQHAIQTEKGMPGGGNPEQFLTPADVAFIREAEMRSGVLEGSIRKDTGAFDSALVQQAVEQVQKGQRMSAAVAREFNKIQNHPALPEYLRALEDRIKADDLYMAAREKYLRLPGEIEARIVQARMNMTPAELAVTPPWKTYGINAEGWPTKLAVGAATVAAGGWLFLDEDAAEKIGVGGLVLAGAIKGKGGMWHPEAVTRLAKPLATNMTKLPIEYAKMTPEEVLTRAKALYPDDPASVASYVERANADKVIVQWTDKAVRNWLNKHAGTATDPLKDVKVPMLGEDVRWEDLTDKMIKGESVEGPRGQETQWRIGDPESGLQTQGTFDSTRAITNYLSHAGDYAREFIPPDKLQQYDLVRLIKETAKQDEIQAAKMAKARVNQAGTVTFKEYPDGMKWVEVGKVDESAGVPKGYSVEPWQDRWIVKDKDGKQIDLAQDEWVPSDEPSNNFRSREVAEQVAREHVANLALKNEGDVMGHCVGGYCEMVHSGESKIYSLRDEKGMSHVTIEVAPPDKGINRWVPEDHPDAPTGNISSESAIVQIKGKQNRAPVDKYLPYVQDFVKSGKWGDVGDLENAGLRLRDPLSIYDVEAAGISADAWSNVVESVKGGVEPKTHQGYVDVFNQARKTLGLPEPDKYVSAEEIRSNVLRDRQRGSIDPDLAKKLGAGVAGAAIGAYLDKDEQLSAGLVGGALGVLGAAALGRAKGRGEPVNRGVDYLGGNISTRMGNLGEMGPAIKKRFRDFERKVMEETKTVTDKVGPFLQDLKGLPGAVKEQVSLALLQQDVAKVKQLLAGSAQTLVNFEVVQRVLQDFERAHKQLGRFKEGITDYFPRIVKDYKGLQKALGSQAAEGLDKWLNKAEKHMLRTEGRVLTDVEQSILINRYLLAEAPLSSLPQHLRQRTVRQVTQTLQPFYEAPEISLSRYVHAAVQDIELAKLFGRNLKLSKASHGTRAINIDESIGAFVRDAKSAGHLTSSQEAQLKDILQSRFGPGEQGARPFWQNVRNVANIGLLGNLISATTQVGDIAMAYYAFGLRPTLIAVGKTLTGKAISAKDFGLANHISEEFATTVSSAKALQKMFKYSGFSAVDMLGKKIILNAALDRYQRMAKTTKGQERIAEKYQAAYGSEFADLLRDLRNGTRSDNVNSLLFSELSDLQPISKMEMPQAYLDMPNGRVVYMLKSFMLKQMDLVRRDIFQEFAKGHTQRALSNLTRYAITVGVAGATVQMVKDMILGKPLKAPEWDDVALNMMKTFGWSKYTLDKAKSGRPIEAMVGIVMPPYAMMDDAIRRDPKALAYIPPVGKLYYERNKDKWKEQRAWDRKHDPDTRMERRMKRLEGRQ